MKKPRSNYPWNPKLTGEALRQRISERKQFVAALMRKHDLTEADVYPERERCTERPR